MRWSRAGLVGLFFATLLQHPIRHAFGLRRLPQGLRTAASRDGATHRADAHWCCRVCQLRVAYPWLINTLWLALAASASDRVLTSHGYAACPGPKGCELLPSKDLCSALQAQLAGLPRLLRLCRPRPMACSNAMGGTDPHSSSTDHGVFSARRPCGTLRSSAAASRTPLPHRAACNAPHCA